ncbi:sulfonate transport system permease protein [Humitalea rosea]|uniref:Sulfonate transport system permease protein n=1 Tax=Humitalea rosea TaxID=990373 RepID=A0A2W7IXA8_9PROT|nr:ABC transporter permease [Humitalea rosea]PZW50825.1 sulfonate transport system permease protein [Humitalea rosea]
MNARGLVLPLGLLALWQGVAAGGLADPRLLAPPGEVAATAWRVLTDPAIFLALGASLGRCLAGFVLGAGLGLCFGLLCGLSRPADRLLGPSFHALKNVAVFAWIPLIAMWFGFGEEARIIFIALATFTPMVLNSWEGIAGTPRALLEVGSVLRFGPWQSLARIRLPAALPSMMTGVQLGLMHAWLATIGAEYFLAKGTGLGGVLIEGRDTFDMALVLVGVVLLGAVGLVLSQMARLGGARLAPWKREIA